MKLLRLTSDNKNGIIDAEDFVGSDGVLIDFTYSDKNIQPQVFNYGFGLSYGFGKRTIKIGGTEKLVPSLEGPKDDRAIKQASVIGWIPAFVNRILSLSKIINWPLK